MAFYTYINEVAQVVESFTKFVSSSADRPRAEGVGLRTALIGRCSVIQNLFLHVRVLSLFFGEV